METRQTWVAVLEIEGLTPLEYDSIVRKMDVERKPAPGIYLHVAAPLADGSGLRVLELWEDKNGCESFIQQRLLPTASALGIRHEAKLAITPLLNLFAPRAGEIAALPQTRVR